MEHANNINRRYLEGLLVAEWNSHTDGLDASHDHVIKRLFVTAVHGEEDGRMELVASVEVEVVSIEDGVDEGYFELRVTVYQIPFPYDSKVRRSIVRGIRDAPKMWIA